MAFTDNKPESGDDINVAIDTYCKSNFTAIKAAITQEHGWSDSSATACTHDQGTGRIFVLPTASAPTPALSGRLWYDTTTGKFYRDTGSSWIEIDLSSTYLSAAGGTMSSDIAMGGNKITNLGLPTSSTDACTKSYADLLVGAGGAHAASHTDGTDDIQTSSDSVKGLMSASDHILLTAHNNSTIRKDIVWADDDINSAKQYYGVASKSHHAIGFDKSSATIAYFQCMRVPYSSYTAATLYFSYVKSAATAGNAVFYMDYTVNGSLVNAASGTTISMGATTSLQSYSGTAISMTGLSANSIISGRLVRSAVDAYDTFTGTIYIVGAYLLFS